MIVRIEATSEKGAASIERDSAVYKDCYVPPTEILVEWTQLQINKLIHAGATRIVATFTKD